MEYVWLVVGFFALVTAILYGFLFWWLRAFPVRPPDPPLRSNVPWHRPSGNHVIFASAVCSSATYDPSHYALRPAFKWPVTDHDDVRIYHG